MDLMKFKGVDNAVKMTIRLSIGYCVVLTIAFMVHPTFRVIRQSCSAKSLSSKYRSSLNP